MTDYLDRALEYVNAVEGDEVVGHRLSDDGLAYILLLDKGIRGCPKYLIPLDKLPKAKQEAEPVKIVEVEEEADELPYLDDTPDLDELGYRDLQALAKHFDIPANQSTADLITALKEVM